MNILEHKIRGVNKQHFILAQGQVNATKWPQCTCPMKILLVQKNR